MQDAMVEARTAARRAGQLDLRDITRDGTSNREAPSIVVAAALAMLVETIDPNPRPLVSHNGRFA
jgi:hypothetical protein